MQTLLALTLIALSLLPSASRSDDSRELSNTIIETVAKQLPPGTAPLTQSELTDVNWAIRNILMTSYYSIEIEEVKTAIARTISEAASTKGATASALAQAGIAAMLDAIGHGAGLHKVPDAQSASLEPPAVPWMSVRQVGSLRIVSMPRLDAPYGLECGDLLNDPTTEKYDAIVLDLRGNEGGLLAAVPNVASQFLDAQRRLFVLARKGEDAEAFMTRDCGPVPLREPLAVLIDDRTDSGGLLLAAVLQDQRRAIVIGQRKETTNASVHSLLMFPSRALAAKVPIGELFLPGNRRLADVIRIDVALPTHDEQALLEAARRSLNTAQR